MDVIKGHCMEMISIGDVLYNIFKATSADFHLLWLQITAKSRMRDLECLKDIALTYE